MDLGKLIQESKEREAAGKQAFEELDDDLCMICHAYGSDKRSLVVRCFYAIHEFVPEALDMHKVDGFRPGDYYLRICKACRSAFLNAMREWRHRRVSVREMPKDSDGEETYDFDKPDMIPVQIAGSTAMLTPDQYMEYKLRTLPLVQNNDSGSSPAT